MKDENLTKARFKVGNRCKCLHHYAFRSDAPFKIVSIATCPLPDNSTSFRYAYVVQYDDGVLDLIPVKNEGGYEMARVKL